MFDTVEKYRGFFKILLVLIALSFVTFTAHSFTQADGDYIVKIGDRTVTEHDLDRIIRNNDLGADATVRKGVYDSLVQQAYLINGAQEMGISISQEQIKKVIMAQPAFQENGTFSQAKFNEYLQRANQSESMFVDGLKQEFYSQNILALMGVGGFVADTQAENVLKIYHSAREVQTVAFPTQQYLNEVKVDDAAIEAFYRQNQKRYVLPQAVKFDYVRVSATDLAGSQKVSEEEIQTATNSKTASDTAEIRTTLQLEKAARTLPVVKENMSEAAFNDSADLSGAARAAGVKIQKHNEWLGRAEAEKAGLPTAVIEALFSQEVLQQRNNSDAIEAGGAVWVVRVSDVRPEKTLALAEIKDQVKQDYIASQAHNLAKAAAANAFAKLQKGESVALSWSPQEAVTLSQAKQALPPQDFLKFMQTSPEVGKPAYALYAELPEPVLMRVNTIKLPEHNPAILDQAKMQLMQMDSMDNLQNYLHYLQRTVKIKQGRQKVREE